jgi:hypothetical protein
MVAHRGHPRRVAASGQGPNAAHSRPIERQKQMESFLVDGENQMVGQEGASACSRATARTLTPFFVPSSAGQVNGRRMIFN